MVAHDISRHLFDPDNHYTGLRMQQGRVMLDSDFNEARMLDDEGQRLFVRDVIGPHGTPDDGFSISTVVPATYNFTISAGTYYLGGLRHEISGTQTFRAQSNWRQALRAGLQPPLPAAPVLLDGPRSDLVYLIGWEQGVSSVEDPEFREQAIAAQDTGYRVRRMHRVYVRKNTPADCSGAFAALVGDLVGGGHAFDFGNNELRSGARLTLGYVHYFSLGADLCKPAALRGYSGAENETLRVQLIGGQRFLWSLDNAAPLYRVGVAAPAAKLVTITFQSKPRDAAHQPRVGQVLEILPWGADLSNNEHVADHPIAPGVGGGVLARIVTPYDPETDTLTVRIADETVLVAMRALLAAQLGTYMFARVWNPGDKAGDDTDEPLLDTSFGLPFLPRVAVPLGGTGLSVEFNRDGIVGDHWIVASRPATTRDAVPWNLFKEAPPHGPRRFYSPLALVHWTFSGSDPQAAVHDCRRKFRPLTRIRGCCTVTVGDGITSFGDFTTITAAIAALPLDEPAKICVLPGVFAERVEIVRNDLVIEGCGARTVLRTPASNSVSDGLVALRGAERITLRSLRIEATGQFGIIATGSSTLTLDRLEITTGRDQKVALPGAAAMWIPTTSSPFPLSTIAFANGSELRVTDCKLTMSGDVSAAANVTIIKASTVRITGCEVTSTTSPGTNSQAWSGIYLSGVTYFQITGNTIAGGVGHGISFGVLVSTSPTPLGWFNSGPRHTLDVTADCPGVKSSLPKTALPPGGGTAVNVDPSNNHHGTIERNRITGMGGSGISVLGFWPDTTTPYRMIGTHHLVIADNIIEGNYRSPFHGPMPLDLLDVIAFGGITLAWADDLRIRDNRIQNNGADFRNPVCGIYVMHGEDIAVENNLIRANGPRSEQAALAGIRAGIALQLVGRPVAVATGDVPAGTDLLRPAALVRGNFVQQPAGRALQIYGIGPMVVEGNTLISEGLTVGWTALVPHCIDIQNIGQSPELVLSTVIPANIAIFPAPRLLYKPTAVDAELVDGRILFTDNQVRFAPVDGTGDDVFCATRLQSYGDVGVLDNQFLTLLPAGGSMFNDTIITAWSTRTNNNRWEDPSRVVIPGGSIPEDDVFETYASATTIAFLNFTTLNQASRCIHVATLVGAPTMNNPTANNQIATFCGATPALNSLLLPP